MESRCIQVSWHLIVRCVRRLTLVCFLVSFLSSLRFCLCRGFKAVSPGQIVLELQKVRPWINPKPKTMDAAFTITVE